MIVGACLCWYHYHFGGTDVVTYQTPCCWKLGTGGQSTAEKSADKKSRGLASIAEANKKQGQAEQTALLGCLSSKSDHYSDLSDVD